MGAWGKVLDQCACSPSETNQVASIGSQRSHGSGGAHGSIGDKIKAEYGTRTSEVLAVLDKLTTLDCALYAAARLRFIKDVREVEAKLNVRFLCRDLTPIPGSGQC